MEAFKLIVREVNKIIIPRLMSRGLYSFCLSVRMFVRNSVTKTKFFVKFLQ